MTGDYQLGGRAHLDLALGDARNRRGKNNTVAAGDMNGIIRAAQKKTTCSHVVLADQTFVYKNPRSCIV